MLLYYLSLVDTPEDKSKLEQLYYEYRELMKYIALDILKDNAAAEDAVHDAFLKLIHYLDGIEDVYSHKTKSFIVIVIKSVSLDHYRKANKHATVNIDDVSESSLSIYEPYEKADSLDVQIVLSKIKILPESYRDILELKIYYGYSDRKIADILHISHSAVRKRLQRARNTLEKLLNDREDHYADIKS